MGRMPNVMAAQPHVRVECWSNREK